MCGEEDVSSRRATYEIRDVSLGLFGSRRRQFCHGLADKSGIIASWCSCDACASSTWGIPIFYDTFMVFFCVSTQSSHISTSMLTESHRFGPENCSALYFGLGDEFRSLVIFYRLCQHLGWSLWRARLVWEASWSVRYGGNRRALWLYLAGNGVPSARLLIPRSPLPLLGRCRPSLKVNKFFSSLIENRGYRYCFLKKVGAGGL